LSNASVRGETRRTDATHATLTVTGVKVTLQLNINIWVPAGASQHLIEHEQGHRQISEYYYDTADKLAERIAAAYLGRRIDISGADLNVESGKMLQQLATEINDEYNKELNPQPTQLLYDTITDHGRNEVIVKDAVEHALKNVVVESAGANNANR
jgi:YD repeat-containing protein